ncbi:hypothetical protein AB0M20_14300 [Actinoplanes sp. NPDC051633]|uniref:hypothetical protein n=1 Tax=Actinoplanes sp. NPDC051633 TaxID=3155670 RepID=UPI00344AB778
MLLHHIGPFTFHSDAEFRRPTNPACAQTTSYRAPPGRPIRALSAAEEGAKIALVAEAFKKLFAGCSATLIRATWPSCTAGSGCG